MRSAPRVSSKLRMTLRYVQVSKNDLQREFHSARLKLANFRPPLPLPFATVAPEASADLPAVLRLWPPPGICWRCIVGNSPTESWSARSAASQTVLPRSPSNSTHYPPPQNEQRLAGQGELQPSLPHLFPLDWVFSTPSIAR